MFTLVASVESKLKDGKISDESPVGKAIMGKAGRGQGRRGEGPAGIIKYKIIKVKRSKGGLPRHSKNNLTLHAKQVKIVLVPGTSDRGWTNVGSKISKEIDLCTRLKRVRLEKTAGTSRYGDRSFREQFLKRDTNCQGRLSMILPLWKDRKSL